MNYRRIVSALIAVSLMGSAVSCGDNKKEKNRESNSSSVESEVIKSEKDGEKSEQTSKSEKSGKQKTTEKKSDGKNSTTATETNADKTTTTASKSKTSSQSSAATAKKNADVTTQKLEPSDKSVDRSKYPRPSGETQQSAEQPEPESQPESEYTAEITMGAVPEVKGSNITVDGTKVTITAGGDYLVRGASDNGQVCVSTDVEEKVKVILDGVDIANQNGPAIMIDEAKKCTVELLDGTVSVLRDGAKDKINDGVIFSNDTLRLKGGGKLCIYSNNAHGIASDDDVIIEGGTFEINSIKSGIFAHDDITVNDGDLTVFGGTNGIKSKGSININGGRCVISGGTKEEKSSIYAESAFNYTGGSVFAAGNQVSALTSSANPYVIVDLGESIDADSTVEMLLDSVQMISFKPHNNFRCLMMLAPEISSGSSYSTVINGSEGKSFKLSDGQNIVDFE